VVKTESKTLTVAENTREAPSHQQAGGHSQVSLSPQREDWFLVAQHAAGNLAVQRLFRAGALSANETNAPPTRRYTREGKLGGIVHNGIGEKPHLVHTGLTIQRFPENGMMTTTPDAESPPAPSPQGLIVEDLAQALEPSQLTRSQFLSQLRAAVSSTAEQALSSSSWAMVVRPQVHQEIERQFGLYQGLDGPGLEHSIRQQVPGAGGATTAGALIPPICAQVRQSIVANLPKEESLAGGVGMVTGALGSLAQGVANAVADIGSIFFKARAGGAREAGDPRVIRAQLRGGHRLDSGLQEGMAAAFGHDFSHVRVHTDAHAARLAARFNARAFTVGQDIAFGTGEYQPGTLVGDALLAHELAHVVQQHGSDSTSTRMPKSLESEAVFEAEADQAAVGVLMTLWGKMQGSVSRLAPSAVPRLRSGLQLRRCSKSEPTPPVISTAPSVTSAPSVALAPSATPPSSEPLSEQLRKAGRTPQQAIDEAVRKLRIDVALMEDGQMHYNGTVPVGEGTTYPPGDENLKKRRPGKPPNTKPYVEIYGGAFLDGLPLLASTVWHEYQHVMQMAPQSKMLVPGVKIAGDAQEVEAYCNELILAEEQKLHLQEKIQVQNKQGKIEEQSGPEYVEKTLWRRLNEHWNRLGEPMKKTLQSLHQKAKAAAERMVGHPL
jgi:Domain of unknown function (DUF4157)